MSLNEFILQMDHKYHFKTYTKINFTNQKVKMRHSQMNYTFLLIFSQIIIHNRDPIFKPWA